MVSRLTLVIATRNKGKTVEIKEALKDFPVDVKDLGAFGPIPAVEEDGTSFEENAYKKASFTARVLGMPALADDSGLVVEALNGRPGIHSARYAGEHSTDEENCVKLLGELNGKKNRKAAFECVLSIAVPTGVALTYEARCEGEIAEAPAGVNGFGYDPVFYYASMGMTFAEMSIEKKRLVSHRGKALEELQGEFGKVLKWIQLQMPVDEKFVCRPGQR